MRVFFASNKTPKIWFLSPGGGREEHFKEGFSDHPGGKKFLGGFYSAREALIKICLILCFSPKGEIFWSSFFILWCYRVYFGDSSLTPGVEKLIFYLSTPLRELQNKITQILGLFI